MKAQPRHAYLPFLRFMQRSEVFADLAHKVVFRVLDFPILNYSVGEVSCDFLYGICRNVQERRSSHTDHNVGFTWATQTWKSFGSWARVMKGVQERYVVLQRK